MLSETNDNGDDGSSEQDLINLIIKVLKDQLPERLDLGWWERILSVTKSLINLSVLNTTKIRPIFP